MLVKLWLLSFLAALAAGLLYLNGPHDAYLTLLLFAALGLHAVLTVAWWARKLFARPPASRP